VAQVRFLEGLAKGSRLFGENLNALVNAAALSIVYILGIGLTSLAVKPKSCFEKQGRWKKLKTAETPESYYKQY
jgi:hypothetical protein